VNVRLANYEFCNEINQGDKIVVKKGSRELVGLGTVTSDYYFDDKAENFKSRRNVKWEVKNSTAVPFDLANKTLTNITSYNDDRFGAFDSYAKLLEAIVKKEYNPLKKWSPLLK